MAEQSPGASETMNAEISDPDNPYVGPRPFRTNEQHLFFGRERDAGSVVNSLLSSRVMLLHSPSGAGKTSIIQISVVPAFRKRDFLVCARFEPKFSALRTNLPPPTDFSVSNRYVFSVANGLVGDFTDREQTGGMTLNQAFNRYAEHHKRSDRPQLVVIDQLEEVLTLERGTLTARWSSSVNWAPPSTTHTAGLSSRSAKTTWVRWTVSASSCPANSGRRIGWTCSTIRPPFGRFASPPRQ